jgi:hypothetical protein
MHDFRQERNSKRLGLIVFLCNKCGKDLLVYYSKSSNKYLYYVKKNPLFGVVIYIYIYIYMCVWKYVPPELHFTIVNKHANEIGVCQI